MHQQWCFNCSQHHHYPMDLFENVLLSHKFLSLSVWLVHRHLQGWLAIVKLIDDKENHILQQFNGIPVHREGAWRSDTIYSTTGLLYKYLQSKNYSCIGPKTSGWDSGLVLVCRVSSTFCHLDWGKPNINLSTTVLNMKLASFAKSRSLISMTGTETMAKASLSSLVGQVPS